MVVKYTFARYKASPLQFGYVKFGVAQWHMVVRRALELRSTGRGFDSRPPRFLVQPWEVVAMCLCYQAVFGTGISWEDNRIFCVALAMHHRHGDLSTYRLNGLRREVRTPMFLQKRDTFITLRAS